MISGKKKKNLLCRFPIKRNLCVSCILVTRMLTSAHINTLFGSLQKRMISNMAIVLINLTKLMPIFLSLNYPGKKSAQIVEEMSTEQRKILLFFWTSVKYLPVEGFRGLASRLYIYRSSEPHDRLPSSHTCFYRLCFPPYSSMCMLQDRLRIITQEHFGSSFGTWWR